MSILRTHNLQNPDSSSINIVMDQGGNTNITGVTTVGGSNFHVPSGSVGIGTESPVTMLEVGSQSETLAGAITISNGETIAGGSGPLINLKHGPAGGTQRTHQIYSYIGDLRIVADSNENMEFHTGGSESLRITSAGTVKIGGNTLATANGNADNLIIDTGDVDSGISILSATTGRIYFGDATDAAAGSIRYAHTDNSMRFEASGGERLRIDSSGNAILKTANGAFKSENPNSSGDYVRMYAGAGTAQWDIYGNGELLRMSENSGNSAARVQFDLPTTHRSTSTTTGVAALTAQQEVNNGGYLIFDGKNSSGTSVFNVTHNGRVRVSDGIDFSSNSNTSGMTSELLDDYEEGTFEPIFRGASGTFNTVVYHSDTGGRYTKVGNLVMVTGCVRISGGTLDKSNISSTDTLCIGGLPFNNNARTNGDNADNHGTLRVPVWSGSNCPNFIQARQNVNYCNLYFIGSIGSIHSTNQVSQLTNQSMVQFTLVYTSG